jgi:putative membrane-bound dehydrogenase-like protein
MSAQAAPGQSERNARALPELTGLGERIAMIGSVVGLWIALSSTVAAEGISKPEPPRALDSRLVFERIAAEPEIVTPTGIAVDSRGRVLVIESHTHFRPAGYPGPPADRIRLFEDRDHDGKPECVGTFFEGTRMTMNLKVAGDDSVFVATRSALYHLWDRDGDGRADGVTGGTLPTPFVRLDTTGDYPHNGLSGFAFDFVGNVYFGLGENLGADYRLIGSDGVTLTGGGEGGNIYRCRPDGSKLERLATGFWNPFHMTFDGFGRLFAVDNDPDSRPPCRLLHIVPGGDYGYRFRNGRKGLHPFTAWDGELPGTLGMVAGTGEAPSGVVEYDRDNLPEDYRGSLLVTSWGDHRIEQYRIEPHGATFRATMKPVVVGGEDFRPVGIAIAPDGALYISDWVDKSYDLHGKGRIWRLRYAGTTAANSSPGRDGSAPARRSPKSNALALVAAVAAGKIDKDLAASFLRSESADIRALAVSILPASLFELKDVAASDPSLLVRAAAMRRLADPAAKDVLLKALESDDPFLQQATRVGLGQSLKAAEILASAGSKAFSPAQRLGLLLILRDADRPEARAVLPAFLSDPDPNIRFAAIQWVGEHRLTEFRSRLQAALTSSAETRGLFEATLAAIEMLDGKARGPLGEVAGEEYIVALLKDRRTPAPILRHALRMLRPDHPALTIDFFRRLLTNPDAAVRIEAVRSLCQSPLRNRFETLGKLADDPSASVSLRAEAIAGLADDAASGRERLLALAAGERPALRHEALRSLRGIRLTDDQRSKLRTGNRGDTESLELLDFLTSDGTATSPQANRKDPPATDIDAWLARLNGPADPAAGERVFFHTKGPGCYRCHQVDGRGSRAGPDLTNLAAGIDRRRLVESIVAPSKEIAPQFVAYTAARADGTVFDGILLEQSPEGDLVFADSKGRRIVVKTGDIAERKPQTVSIMPADLPRTMTTQEMRDLLAFLSRNR